MTTPTQTLLEQRLHLLNTSANRHLLTGGLRGIERETLRVNSDGALNISAHPAELGAALTHPLITTDYSESLLEFITPASVNADAALNELDAIHRFAYTQLGAQKLWSQSMPCHLPSEADIPIAWYGNSHIGMLKHVYRRGLALRYGKAMQCIAGIHYNYSFDDALWQALPDARASQLNAQDLQSERYIDVIRNFHRYSWILMYLFGASPALSSDFLRGHAHDLETLSGDTLYLPYATSLRMSDLGYQNNAQDGLVPPYNTLREYMSSLSSAVLKPYAAYEALGTQRDGQWVQINTNVLQIENEFYATIRPKRVIKSGERPVEALCSRGVQYIEVRCMDINPFDSVGINLQTSRFLDAFLMFCALSDSPPTNQIEWDENAENFSRVVKQGRKPGLELSKNGQTIAMTDWATDLLNQIGLIANAMDSAAGSQEFGASIAAQKAKVLDASLTPSAQVLQALTQHGGSFNAFALAQSELIANEFKARPLSAAQLADFAAMTQTSINQQLEIERNQTGDFDAFITDYRSRTSSNTCGDEADA